MLRLLLLLLLLQVLRELRLLLQQIRLSMCLSLRLRSWLLWCLGLTACISGLEESSSILRIGVLTVLSGCQLLLLQQRGLLLSDIKPEISEACHAELVRIHALSGACTQGISTHGVRTVPVLCLADLLVLLLLVVLRGCEDV